MSIHTLLYSSVASQNFEENHLTELLDQARKFNRAHNITGLLLYHDGSFMQVLEGERQVILELFERKIFFDERHGGVTKYFDHPIEERLFSNWSMGFKKLNNNDLASMPGYSDIFDNPKSALPPDTGIVHEMLNMFITSN